MDEIQSLQIPEGVYDRSGSAGPVFASPEHEALNLPDSTVARVGVETNEEEREAQIVAFVDKKTKELIEHRDFSIANTSADVDIAGFTDKIVIDDHGYRRAA